VIDVLDKRGLTLAPISEGREHRFRVSAAKYEQVDIARRAMRIGHPCRDQVGAPGVPTANLSSSSRALV
jgi:hypothetical protein